MFYKNGKDSVGQRLEYDHKVAEVKIEKAGKKEDFRKLGLCSLLEPEMEGDWSATTRGTVLREPAEKGQTCRFYLARNSYDGWSRKGNNDGGYNVVYVNGIQLIDK